MSDVTSDVRHTLETADLTIEGRLAGASNATLRASAGGLLCVVKPVAGERPLWDFPEATLSGREVAAHAVSELLGWGLVPPTIWREDTPVGPAMVQQWIDVHPDITAVEVCTPSSVPGGWAVVLEARDEWGQPLVLAHDRHPDIARIAAFDAVINNADRKGGHVLVDEEGRRWAIDHGVCFAAEDKLRTVLWGWAGERIPEDVLRDLVRLRSALTGEEDEVDGYLDAHERRALRERLDDLVTTGVYPVPSAQWPAVPWPVM